MRVRAEATQIAHSQRKPRGRLQTWLDVVQAARLRALRHPRTSQSAGPRGQIRGQPELRVHRLSRARLVEERHWQILDERGVDGQKNGHRLQGAIRCWPARHFWCVPGQLALRHYSQTFSRAVSKHATPSPRDMLIRRIGHIRVSEMSEITQRFKMSHRRSHTVVN